MTTNLGALFVVGTLPAAHARTSLEPPTAW